MPRKSLLLFLAVLFATALGISRAVTEEEFKDEIQVLKNILRLVKENHIKEIDEEKLFEGAYRGMLLALQDPYTQYFNKRDTRAFQEDTRGKFGGLGIRISIKDGLLTVISPIRGTPAYKAGVLPGDVILKIDGKSTERIKIEEAVKTLKGKSGTKVTITVRHRGSPVDRDITIIRAVIKPPSAEYEMIDKKNGIGLMRISGFSETMMSDLHLGIKEMREQNLKGLILDLRNNPGGLLPAAVRMADEFIAEGRIVSTKGRHERDSQEFWARKGQSLESLPVIVLINNGSASASEIVAGALKDRGRALLVGDRTFGKGSVQKVVGLGNDRTLKLTTAKYYMPSGKPIEDHVGIEPDIRVPMSLEDLIALRQQELEDMLRGSYHLGGLIEEDDEAATRRIAVPPEDQPDDKEPGNDKSGAKKDETGKRRKRKVDFQLKSALNILRWQLSGFKSSATALK